MSKKTIAAWNELIRENDPNDIIRFLRDMFTAYAKDYDTVEDDEAHLFEALNQPFDVAAIEQQKEQIAELKRLRAALKGKEGK